MRREFITVGLGRALDLELNVHGAPNFRAPRQGGLNVFGAAQPRTQGLRAILSILRCRLDTPNPSHVVWFSTREEPIGTCITVKSKYMETRISTYEYNTLFLSMLAVFRTIILMTDFL